METNLFATAYEALRAHDAAVPAWLREARQAAYERFLELGLPTTRDEDWKYTNPAPISRGDFHPAKAEAGIDRTLVDQSAFGAWAKHRMVFVNGRYQATLSNLGALPQGVSVRDFATVSREDADFVRGHFGAHVDSEQHVFAMVNAALVTDGAVIFVPRGKAVEEPIELLFVQTGEAGAMAHPRILIVAEDNAEVTVVEHYVGAGASAPSLTNSVTEVSVGQNASVKHYIVQRQGRESFHVETVHANQARDSRFRSLSIALGAALARNDIEVNFTDERAECSLDGLYMTTGTQHTDFHTTITHAKPHCTSRELFKGIAAGKSTGVFNGRIVVPPHAQKTDSNQGNHNLLLSPDASIYTKPQLEIYADDVKCAHGTTIGQLDELAIFYLRSRGIGQDQARGLLTYAFAKDIVDRIPFAPLREGLEKEVLEWLPANAGL
jgi:Fe-S cluster assembly protein SufD